MYPASCVQRHAASLNRRAPGPAILHQIAAGKVPWSHPPVPAQFRRTPLGAQVPAHLAAMFPGCPVLFEGGDDFDLSHPALRFEA